MSMTLLAVDGNSLLHRSFHANARLGFTLPDGRPAWAVRGLLSQLAAAVDRSCATSLVVGFDDPQRSVRRELWPQYKAQRDPKLAALSDQLELAVDALTELGVCVVAPAGLEADDVSAAAARHARTIGARAVIATSDRDAFALIDDNTRVLRILNGGVEASPMLDPARLHLLTGVWPHQYRDYAALRGDPSDNLPGVRGVGRRKAALLLAEFGSAAEAFADAAAGGSRCHEVVGPALTSRLAGAEARDAWQLNVEAMSPRGDISIDVDPATGSGGLPLPPDRVATVFDRYELFLPNGLRALSGVAAEQPGLRDPNPTDATWRPAPPRRSPRFPPLRRPQPTPQLTLF